MPGATNHYLLRLLPQRLKVIIESRLCEPLLFAGAHEVIIDAWRCKSLHCACRRLRMKGDNRCRHHLSVAMQRSTPDASDTVRRRHRASIWASSNLGFASRSLQDASFAIPARVGHTGARHARRRQRLRCGDPSYRVPEPIVLGFSPEFGTFVPLTRGNLTAKMVA